MVDKRINCGNTNLNASVVDGKVLIFAVSNDDGGYRENGQSVLNYKQARELYLWLENNIDSLPDSPANT